MAAAQEQLAQARALADEAAEAARSAADEAHRRARAMTEQAEAQSRAADERAAEADQARGSVAAETAEFVRQTEKAPAVDDLADKTKPELLDLAASLEVDGRSAHDQGRPREGDPPGVDPSPRRVIARARLTMGATEEVPLAAHAPRRRRRGRRHHRERDRLVDQASGGGQVT